MQTWKYLVFLICFTQQTRANRSWTVYQLRDLMVTNWVLPGRQMWYQARLHHSLQGAWHSWGTRGKVAWLSSTMSSPIWLRRVTTGTKSRNKNNSIPFKELLKLDNIQVWNSHDFSELQQTHAWHLKHQLFSSRVQPAVAFLFTWKHEAAASVGAPRLLTPAKAVSAGRGGTLPFYRN